MTSERPVDKNCLSYWFPILAAAGLPVPKTIILEMPQPAADQIWGFFDGKGGGSGASYSFADKVTEAAESLGFPAFLRTGQTSGKHNWRKTCFLQSGDDTLKHIVAIAEFSEMCDFMGLPWHTWAVREMLPTTPITILPQYGGFPLVREVRCFVDSGGVVCHHDYWPRESIKDGMARPVDEDEANQLEADLDEHERLSHVSDTSEFMPLAERVAKAFAGDESFSVDLLPTKRGWFVTDMALADRSFHWPDCSMNPV